MKTYSEKFTSGVMHTVVVKPGTTIFDALWQSGMFESKSFLRILFKEGAIKSC